VRLGGSQEIGRSRACAPDTKQTNVEIAKAEPSSGHRCILFLSLSLSLSPRQAARSAMAPDIVMPALVAGIHVLRGATNKDVDGRNKSGHDARAVPLKHNML
jgi:hypothetical protein